MARLLFIAELSFSTEDPEQLNNDRAADALQQVGDPEHMPVSLPTSSGNVIAQNVSLTPTLALILEGPQRPSIGPSTL